jgi:3-methyladenine DNA glycosylase/8-oxoguanine DNA glycosylase
MECFLLVWLPGEHSFIVHEALRMFASVELRKCNFDSFKSAYTSQLARFVSHWRCHKSLLLVSSVYLNRVTVWQRL